jgi:hypothetical protein
MVIMDENDADNDDNDNVCRPPGRNAATLSPMSISALSSSLSTVAAGNASGSISPQTTIKEQQQHQHLSYEYDCGG